MITEIKKWLLAIMAGTAVGILFGVPFVKPAAATAPLQIDLVGSSETVQVAYETPIGARLDDYIANRSFTINGDTRKVLFMHPPSSASFSLLLPAESASLRFGIAIQPEAWSKPGDGVDFDVHVKHWDKAARRAESDALFSQYIDPKHDASQRRWVDVAVDLSHFGGEWVTLVFSTSPHASPDYDWAGWSGLIVMGR